MKSWKFGPKLKNSTKIPFSDQFLHVRCQIISIFHQKIESGLKMTKFYTKNAKIHILSLEIMIFQIYWFSKYFRFFISFSCSVRSISAICSIDIVKLSFEITFNVEFLNILILKCLSYLSFAWNSLPNSYFKWKNHLFKVLIQIHIARFVIRTNWLRGSLIIVEWRSDKTISTTFV